MYLFYCNNNNTNVNVLFIYIYLVSKNMYLFVCLFLAYINVNHFGASFIPLLSPKFPYKASGISPSPSQWACWCHCMAHWPLHAQTYT